MGTPNSDNVSTKLQRIAELARAYPNAALKTLAHHIDLEFLTHAFKQLRREAAAGVDWKTAVEYERNLPENLKSLLERMHTGTYFAPPVRRAFIPKDNGKLRPLGIPTIEDRVLQRAVALVLDAVYEQTFRDCSYGFRPQRSAHDALQKIWSEVLRGDGAWIIEADIESFFDAVDKCHLRAFLDKRIQDGVIRRTIGKWLQAGVMQDGVVTWQETGTPQGGNVSPVIANVYLHHVLDVWFEDEVRPRLRGRATLVRYADDFVIICASKDDAVRIFEVLPKRFMKYGLRLHPEKSRIIRCFPPGKDRKDNDNDDSGPSFDFLGFTHYWGKSRKNAWTLMRKTMSSRLTRSLKRIREWCRDARHWKVEDQHKTLERKMRGYYNYYGLIGNYEALSCWRYEVGRIWHYWLSRRSQRAYIAWPDFNKLLTRYPLPFPRIVQTRAHRVVAKP